MALLVAWYKICVHIWCTILLIEPWKRVCYMTNTAYTRTGAAKFSPAKLDPTLCTHVILGYAGLKDRILSQTGHNDDSKRYKQFLLYASCVLCDLNDKGRSHFYLLYVLIEWWKFWTAYTSLSVWTLLFLRHLVLTFVIHYTSFSCILFSLSAYLWADWVEELKPRFEGDDWSWWTRSLFWSLVQHDIIWSFTSYLHTHHHWVPESTGSGWCRPGLDAS